MHYLYTKSCSASGADSPEGFLASCRMEVFQPSPFRLSYSGEETDLKTRLGRFYFWIITRGRYRIFCMLHGDEVVHTSCVVPKCGKFSFLKKGDYEIGPCVTSEKFRGRGVYQYVLRHITSQQMFQGANFYMIVREDNFPSVRGIEKSGFLRCGTVTKTRWLKNYKKESEYHG